jgi:hypothetical protein
VPLGERKAKLLARAGIVFNQHTDEDGATVFRHACVNDRLKLRENQRFEIAMTV